jgi:cell division protein FtsN
VIKAILKYGLYFFLGLWMFGLGVMVGRDNSPITFDTRGFQARLETIVKEYGNQAPSEEKVDLKFYDALNNPVRHEIKGRQGKAGEIVPKREPPVLSAPSREIPVKLSKKQASLNQDLLAEVQKKSLAPKPKPAASPEEPKVKKAMSKPGKSSVSKAGSTAVSTTGGKKAKADKPKVPAGKYTIQVAAYKDFKDAVTQMAILEKKGIDAYRIRGEKGGITWYRVRTGAFTDYDAAKAGLEKLNQARVGGMIIKKEE